jgi:putative acetyltransferase
MMRIEQFQPKHAAAVARVHRKSIRQIASEDYTEEEIATWSSQVSKDLDIPEDKHRFVALQGEAVVGFAEYRENNEITGLYVHPGFTSQGIGSRLLAKIEEKARSRGLSYLKATATVTANPFYERHGYDVLHETTYQIEDQDLKVYKVLKEL